MGGKWSTTNASLVAPTAETAKAKKFSRRGCQIMQRYTPSFVYHEHSTDIHRQIAGKHWDLVFKDTPDNRRSSGTTSEASGCPREAKHLHAQPNNKITQLYDVFFAYLEDHSPELKSIFRSSMHILGRVLVHISVGMRTMLASDNFADKVLALTKTHLRFGVKKEHYEPVGRALMHAMQVVSGEHWSNEIEDAWKRLFSHASLMLLQAQQRAEKNDKRTKSKRLGSIHRGAPGRISAPTIFDLLPPRKNFHRELTSILTSSSRTSGRVTSS